MTLIEQAKQAVIQLRIWQEERGYQRDDARFCKYTDKVPGIRVLGTEAEPYNPMNVAPIVWDNLANPYAPTLGKQHMKQCYEWLEGAA